MYINGAISNAPENAEDNDGRRKKTPSMKSARKYMFIYRSAKEDNLTRGMEERR